MQDFDNSRFFSALTNLNAKLIKPTDRKIDKFCYWFLRRYPLDTVKNAIQYAYYALLYVGLLGFTMLSFSIGFFALVGLLSYGCKLLADVKQRCIAIHERDAYLKQHKYLAPPPYGHPRDKTPLSTYNYAFSFVLHNNIVWFAPRKNPLLAPKWQPLYFPGLNDRKIKAIAADGENVMARVRKDAKVDEIFYRKVLRAYWDKDKFIIKNICNVIDVRDQWFTLPIVRHLFLQHKGKRLEIPVHHAWLVSYSGAFKDYVTDFFSKKHSNWRITTVYEFDGKNIILHDPYVPPHASIKVPLPADFQLLRWDVSASTIGLLGIENYVNSDKSIQQRYVIYTRALDYDQLGLNPAMRYGYPGQSADGRRVLPMSSWKKHSLPADMSDPLLINVVQTGKGVENIEIKLLCSEHLKKGYYVKKITDNSFQWVNNPAPSMTIEGIKHHHVFRQEARKTKNYTAKNIKLNDTRYEKLMIQSFHRDADSVLVQANTPDGRVEPYMLMQRHNLIKASIGLKGNYWELVPLCNLSSLRKPVIRVNIEKIDDALIIEASEHQLKWQLQLDETPMTMSIQKAMMLGWKSHMASTTKNNTIPAHPILNHIDCSVPKRMRQT